MNNNPKVSLTMQLEGSINKAVGVKVNKGILTALDLFPNRFLTDKERKSKEAQHIIRRFKWKQKTFENVPATKHLTLTVDAYNYMTSSEVPAWYSPNVKQRISAWNNLKPEQRLQLHLACIAQENHATSFTYNILED